jgi:hypothetical protein
MHPQTARMQSAHMQSAHNDRQGAAYQGLGLPKDEDWFPFPTRYILLPIL